MPSQKQEKSRLDSESCREKCLKKYLKPGLREYRGNTFGEKVDYCASAYYACCKPEQGQDNADRKDIWKECKDRVTEKLKENQPRSSPKEAVKQ